MWNDKTIGMVCLAIIEVVALLMGYNGQIQIMTMTAIAGLGGFAYGQSKQKTPVTEWKGAATKETKGEKV